MTQTPSNEDRDGEPVSEPVIDETHRFYHSDEITEADKGTWLDPEVHGNLFSATTADAVPFKPGTFRYFGESFDPGRSEIISSTNADDPGAPTNEHSDLRAYREGQVRLGIDPTLPFYLGDRVSPSDPIPSEETTVQTPDTDHPTIESSLTYERRQEQMYYAGMRFRVYHVPQVPGKAFRVQCASIDVALALLDVLAQYDLFQLHHRVKPDYCNANGIEYFDYDEGEWYEFDVKDELEDYREAMQSPAVMGLDTAEVAIPGWVLEPGQAMKVVRD